MDNPKPTDLTIAIYAKILSALLVFAPEKDTRPQLNGITVEISPDKTYLVATDGSRMGVAHLETSTDINHTFSVIIPKTAFKGLKLPRDHNCVITIHDIPKTNPQVAGPGSSHKISIHCAGMRIITTSVDATPIDWKRVMPQAGVPLPDRGDVAQFNPIYIGDLAKVTAALYGPKTTVIPYIHHNGQGAAIVTFGVDIFAALIMPIRDKSVSDRVHAIPTWFSQ